MPATSEARRQAQRLGLNITDHSTLGITGELVNSADLILVMEHGHKEALCSEFPNAAAKVHLISELAGGIAYDLPDPISPATACEVSDEIRDIIHQGLERMRAWVAAGPSSEATP